MQRPSPPRVSVPPRGRGERTPWTAPPAQVPLAWVLFAGLVAKTCGHNTSSETCYKELTVLGDQGADGRFSPEEWHQMFKKMDRPHPNWELTYQEFRQAVPNCDFEAFRTATTARSRGDDTLNIYQWKRVMHLADTKEAFSIGRPELSAVGVPVDGGGLGGNTGISAEGADARGGTAGSTRQGLVTPSVRPPGDIDVLAKDRDKTSQDFATPATTKVPPAERGGSSSSSQSGHPGSAVSSTQTPPVDGAQDLKSVESSFATTVEPAAASKASAPTSVSSAVSVTPGPEVHGEAKQEPPVRLTATTLNKDTTVTRCAFLPYELECSKGKIHIVRAMWNRHKLACKDKHEHMDAKKFEAKVEKPKCPSPDVTQDLEEHCHDKTRCHLEATGGCAEHPWRANVIIFKCKN